MTKSEFFQQLSEMKVTVPFYMYSEEAAEAFCRLNQQRLWQARPEGVVPQRPMDEDRALSIFKAAAAEGRRELTTRESLEVLTPAACALAAAAWLTAKKKPLSSPPAWATPLS